ncbi:hypothetical protein HQ545_03625 [Candidatus Woesearchaeota archaeon]|nr:hypothetical protein [Candidatus Woesearchaeota archaeon]
MNARQVLKTALDADVVPDLPVLDISDSACLEHLLDNIPDGGFVSEWRNDVGSVSYEYRIHGQEEGVLLRELCKSGSVGGYPRLTKVYSGEDIIRLGRA